MRFNNTSPDVFYITPADNLPSILRHGVLSQNGAAALDVKSTIYDESVAAKRKQRKTGGGKTLPDFASFYFNPRNPMLYRVHCCERHDVVILKMKKDILRKAKYVAVGNAAADISDILPVRDGLAAINAAEIKACINAEIWGAGEGKRLIMSELLVPEKAAPDMIDSVYAPNAAAAAAAQKLAGGKVPVIPEPKLFFDNTSARKLDGAQITIINGDMFFSKCQTLTISVNTVGVMGGGLAARIKDNIPDIYVKFQKLCRSKRLTTKAPYVYKEPLSYDEMLADAPKSLTQKPNDVKYFLLFATKEDWRRPSKTEYIKDGFEWLLKNARGEGITSLAMPALGCGLGGLPWAVVGPIMCRYLHKLDMPCEIYLPREGGGIPDEQLKPEFLLDDEKHLFD